MYKYKRYLPVFILLSVAIAFMGDAVWIYSKAQLAQLLIKQAWQQSLESHQQIKPWPWADTWPVARLEVMEKDIDLYILQGASGSSLAFGPGYMLASAPLGSGGSTVIAGHRDTHFKFLQDLRRGQRLRLTLANGEKRNFDVSSTSIVDSQYQKIHHEYSIAAIVLVTCYPFNAIRSGGSLRYVVNAIEV